MGMGRGSLAGGKCRSWSVTPRGHDEGNAVMGKQRDQGQAGDRAAHGGVQSGNDDTNTYAQMTVMVSN